MAVMLAALALTALLATPQAPVTAAPSPAPPAPTQPLASPAAPFDLWLADAIVEARAIGFTDELIHRTLVGLEPLPRVVASDRSQAEIVLTLDRYLGTRVTPLMVRRGREMARLHTGLLDRLERTYGVPRQYLLAIWGMESRFGRLTGRTPVFQALATLAWEPRRAAFFRGQLFDALRMVERGDIEASAMTGSWAGAMGQTQFLPSSYLKYAVDYDGDGRRDIWSSTADALASIANYLRGYGWTPGSSWGREVRVTDEARAVAAALPQRGTGCSAFRTMTAHQPLAEWQQLGIRRLDGSALPSATRDAGLTLVGDRAFLTYPNYDAILGYNCAHFYALSVSMLADRLD